MLTYTRKRRREREIRERGREERGEERREGGTLCHGGASQFKPL